jgi:membrane protein
MSAPAAEPARGRGPLARILDLPPIRKPRSILGQFNAAGGSLLAEGLAYSALFAGLTGLLFAVGILGYLVPDESARRPIIDAFNGQLASLAPAVGTALDTISRNAGTFSLVGLAGLAWGASHFYGALDEAIGRVFALAPARGALDRILRGFVSVLLLVGGLFSGIAISAIQAFVSDGIGTGVGADEARALEAGGGIVLTAVAVIAAVAIVYRIVPNTHVPLRALRLPAVVAGLILTALTRILVFLAPILTGGLSVFGSVAAVFAALAWLHLAFQVLLLGAAWTSMRLAEAGAEETPR